MNVLKKRRHFGSVILIVAIILVSALFHYPVHIVDALTLEPLSAFGIHISIWRILFEPVLGLLLFFNRSFYAITEIQIVLVWILVIFIIYTFIQSVLTINKHTRKRFILIQLGNLPIIIGLWFTFFVIIIFIPLPNNTIINNSPNTILVTTHSHSEFSHDGLISEEGLWKWHKYNGFDAFFITDHANHNKTLDFVQAQRDHQFPGEPLVMCGEEYSGSNHLSLLGLKRKFSTQGFPDSTVMDSTHASNGAVIVNHWFDGEHKTLDYYRNLGVDGFEIENTGTDRTYDRKVYQKIKDFCGLHHLIMNGGLDFHGYGNACSLWNAFEIPGWHNLNPEAKEAAILKVIKTRDQSKLRVLLYNDRPYYSKKYLIFSPLFTLFNYFRTLNLYQISSWIFWILTGALIKKRISHNHKLKRELDGYRFLPVLGIFGSLFMLFLGLDYFIHSKAIVGYTKMYHEYSTLLLSVGIAFFICSTLLAFFRKRKASQAKLNY